MPIASRSASPAGSTGGPDLLRQTVEELRSQVKQQQQEFDELTTAFRRIQDEFQDLKRALGG
jgi:hypothetical protein